MAEPLEELDVGLKTSSWEQWDWMEGTCRETRTRPLLSLHVVGPQVKQAGSLGASPAASHPRGVDRWRHRGGDGGGGDVANDGQGLLQSLVGPQHLVPPLRLLLGLVHQGVLVACRVQLGEQLRVDELFHLVARGGYLYNTI